LKQEGGKAFEGRNLSVAIILEGKTDPLPSLCGSPGQPAPLQGHAAESDPPSRAPLVVGK